MSGFCIFKSNYFFLQVNLTILKDRLYNALGKQTYGIQAPQCPFQKVDVLPEGGVRQQVKATQASRNVGQKQHTTYQSQAKSMFNTVTTSSPNPYYNPNQYQYSSMNGTVTSQAQNYYNPAGAANPMTQPQPAISAVSKGKG